MKGEKNGCPIVSIVTRMKKRVKNGGENQHEMGKKMLFYVRRKTFRVRRTTYGECKTML